MKCLIFLTEDEGKDEGSKDSGVATTSAPGPTTPGTEVWWKVRLPHNIVPVHYDVTLYIDLKKLEFYGDVAILVNVTEPTENVLVHVNKMNISSASVEKASGGGKQNLSFVDCTCPLFFTNTHGSRQGSRHTQEVTINSIWSVVKP